MGSLSFQITQLRGGNLPEMELIAGSILAGTTTGVSVNTGKGFTVTYVSTGLYKIVPNKVIPRTVMVLASLVKATAGDSQVEVVDHDLAGNGFVTLRVCKTSDGSVVAPQTTDLIDFLIIGLAAKLPVK